MCTYTNANQPQDAADDTTSHVLILHSLSYKRTQYKDNANTTIPAKQARFPHIRQRRLNTTSQHESFQNVEEYMWHGRMITGEVGEVITDSIEAFTTSYDQPLRGHAGIDEQIEVEADSNGPRSSRPKFS